MGSFLDGWRSRTAAVLVRDLPGRLDQTRPSASDGATVDSDKEDRRRSKTILGKNMCVETL